MKNFISINMKYYKKSRIKSLVSHNTRELKADYLLNKEDIILSNYNSNDIEKSFNHYYKKMEEINKNKKSFTKENGNHILEAVVSLSHEKIMELIKEKGKEQAREEIIFSMKKLMEELEKQKGFKSLGFNLHFDEGHKKDGEVLYNIHSHITFLNYNFNENKTVLKYLKKKDFIDMQDIAGEVFSNLGFRRGEHNSNKKHLERDEFIKHKQDVQEIALKEQLTKAQEELTLYKEQLKQEARDAVDEETKEIIKNKLKEITATQRTFKKTLQDKTLNILEKSKTFMSFDKDILRNEIYKELLNISQIKLINTTEQELLKEQEELKKQNTELQEQQEKLKTEIHTLKIIELRAEGLEKDIDKIENRYITKIEKIQTETTEEIKTLQKQNTGLYKQLKQQKEELTQLQQQNKELLKENTQLKEEIKQYKPQNQLNQYKDTPKPF